MQKILITGSNGFIGKNLVTILNEKEGYDLLEFDKDNDIKDLDRGIIECDWIVHLAGSNRPENISEYKEVNFGLTETIVNILQSNQLNKPIIFASSTQAELDNPYGKSKLLAEEYLIDFAKKTDNEVYIYSLTNVFGKWCRPNYNSVVATFCNNIAKELPIKINDPDANLKLIYIDDITENIIRIINNKPQHSPESRLYVQPFYEIKLGELAELISSFKESRKNLLLPDVSDEFTKKLYSTYLSYLNEDNFSYELKTNRDERGDLTELIKSQKFGQFFVSTTKPGITRGNHYHHTKTEKFIVIKGKAEICFRQIQGDSIIKYEVTGDKITPIDIPPGYTHNITNTGDTDLITLFWANEIFNPDKPDTYFEEVRIEDKR
ncbi:MAG: NAD-dependent epimerase/dehydratase family protein [Bacteroidetes bacterium]|nr:NAD-dependent epimerase/dehydratase family protein [Bacteroidota bacterium]